MLPVTDACCCWPFLGDLLKIQDASIGIPVEVNREVSFVLSRFNVIRLGHMSNEHPRWRYDDSGTHISKIAEVQVVAKFAVGVH